jgi:hypothetical protein
LRGEIFPFVYMRSINEQKEGVIRVFEYEFRNCGYVCASCVSM